MALHFLDNVHKLKDRAQTLVILTLKRKQRANRSPILQKKTIIHTIVSHLIFYLILWQNCPICLFSVVEHGSVSNGYVRHQ